MKKQSVCYCCGAPMQAGGSICVSCEAGVTTQEVISDVPDDAVLLFSGVLIEQLRALHQKYLSRPEVSEAYKAYVSQHSDVPAQSRAG